MFKSRLKKGLARKYAIKHFTALTEQGKECLWTLTTFAMFAVVVSYFGAHFLLFLTGYYNQPQSQIVVQYHTQHGRR